MDVPVAAMLPDGKRLHLQHGPIDLIVLAEGAPEQVNAAYGAAMSRFETVLEELADELDLLRQYVPQFGLGLQGEIARTMERAVMPHWKRQITPMAAVAGSVADHILEAMTEAAELKRAYVNNGGDIALHLAPNEIFTVGSPSGDILISSDDNVHGIATSGWRGRSFSLGIADAVTVLAEKASFADAAATLIANGVDLPFSPKIARQPASVLAPDSDLKERFVTVAVDDLTPDEIFEALGNGVVTMQSLLKERQLVAVSLMLSNEVISLKCALPTVEDEDLDEDGKLKWLGPAKASRPDGEFID
jgi:uncharacterized protein